MKTDTIKKISLVLIVIVIVSFCIGASLSNSTKRKENSFTEKKVSTVEERKSVKGINSISHISELCSLEISWKEIILGKAYAKRKNILGQITEEDNLNEKELTIYETFGNARIGSRNISISRIDGDSKQVVVSYSKIEILNNPIDHSKNKKIVIYDNKNVDAARINANERYQEAKEQIEKRIEDSGYFSIAEENLKTFVTMFVNTSLGDEYSVVFNEEVI